MKTTLTADKVRLGLAVAPIGKTTYRASLAGMSGVNSDNLDTESLSLVIKEPLELGKAPGVKPSFGFTPPCPDSGADVSEVFNHDSSAGGDAFQNRSRENVVAIPSEALLTPSEVSKVPFSTLRPIGLQSLSQAETPFDDFLPVAVSVKAIIRANGWSGDAEVNPDRLPIRDKGHIGKFDNDMQIKSSLTKYQVGGGSRRADSIVSVIRKGEGYMLPADSGRKVDSFRFPVNLEGVQVISRRTHHRLWAESLKPLLRPGYSRPNRLRSLLASLNVQVRDKSGISHFAVSVSQAVQGIGIAIPLVPAYFADGIKRVRELGNRILQGFNLLAARIKPDLYRSIHTDTLPYASHNLQIQGKEVGQFLCQINQAVPLP